MSDNDTIVAQATPPGRGGVGILRISGFKAREVAENRAGVNCLSRATPIIFRLKTPMAACSIRGLRYGSLARTRSPAKMCWNCRVMAVR
ncbi:tRNA modification GTPase TrmE [Escherichia coli]|nr:tRNA modification GTPase TrmE [Escherichia coli]